MKSGARRQETASAIDELGVIAIVRVDSSEGIVEVARAVLRGGVRALEVTLTVPGAVDAIARLADEVPELLLGAGTVTTTAEVDAVARAGASYVVSPIFSRGVLLRAHELELAALPGCFTPTEMFDAAQAGADFVKLFPAGVLSPRYLKDILAPMPDLRVIPTGGITPENAGEWIRAGARGVGVGTALIDSKSVRARDFAELEARARAFSRSVQGARVLH